MYVIKNNPSILILLYYQPRRIQFRVNSYRAVINLHGSGMPYFLCRYNIIPDFYGTLYDFVYKAKTFQIRFIMAIVLSCDMSNVRM